MKEKKISIKDISSYISSIGIIFGFICGGFMYFYGYKTNQEHIEEGLKTTQRMALKSVININFHRWILREPI